MGREKRKKKKKDNPFLLLHPGCNAHHRVGGGKGRGRGGREKKRLRASQVSSRSGPPGGKKGKKKKKSERSISLMPMTEERKGGISHVFSLRVSVEKGGKRRGAIFPTFPFLSRPSRGKKKKDEGGGETSLLSPDVIQGKVKKDKD